MSITPAPETSSSDDWAAAPAHGSATPGLPAPHGASPSAPTIQPTVVVSMKTPGIAILLSLLWLGAGHLYAGRTATGLALVVAELFLFLLLMIPLIGWVLAPLGWLGLFIFAAISSSNAVKKHNARLGVARF